MWKFWAILILVMVGAGAYAVVSARAPRKPEQRVARAPVELPAPPVAPPAPKPEVAAPKPVVPAEKPAEKPVEKPAEPAAGVEAPTPANANGAASPEEPFEALIPAEGEVLPPPAAEPPPVPGAEALAKFGDFEVLPAKVEKRDDGSLLLDGKFPLRGEGTAEKPYIITWDLLVSVEEAFDPQNGRRRLPERITMIDGKHVRIAGYVAFPMTSQEPQELLSMLNQWDGCCIGTPPTPYDAIEVALREPIEGDDRFATTGRVAGVFHVKPYLQGDWLIGLYVMDDATLTPRDFGGAGAN
jgi:hypothetical protein